MRQYELTVLLHPDLEIDIEKPLAKLRKLIEANGGKITNEDIQGKRRLAYVIAKENFGLYVYFDLDLPPESVSKIDTTLNITDEVIRHLLVSVDPKEKAGLLEQLKDQQKNRNGSYDRETSSNREER